MRCPDCAATASHSSWCPRAQGSVALGPWIEQGHCGGLDMFAPGYARSMIEVCQGCPVQRECAEYAIAAAVDDGIWGGLAPHVRRSVRSGFKTLDEVLP